jgi:hypothetical protein
MAANLDELLRSMHNSVIEAQKITDEQHLRSLKKYFKFNDDDNTWVPVTVPLSLPAVNPETNRVEYNSFDIPLIALNPNTSIKIKNLKMEFEAKISGFENEKERKKKSFSLIQFLSGNREEDPEDKGHSGPLQLNLDNHKSGTMAKITMEFENSETPEAVARINDQIVKVLPI